LGEGGGEAVRVREVVRGLEVRGQPGELHIHPPVLATEEPLGSDLQAKNS